MKRIGLLSDTHSYLDPAVFDYFTECEEIWHAGDFGNMDVADSLANFRPLRGVYGNIDSSPLRKQYSRDLLFECEGVRVCMTHIGGYPGKYNARVRAMLHEYKPMLYICGHSHIVKVIYDKEFELLHMNPGACGYEGFHKVRTLLRFDLHKGRILNVELVELGRRTRKLS